MPILTSKQLERQRQENESTAQATTTSAEPATIDIRAQQSKVEREAESAKATVRETQRKERRGRELPFKPARTRGGSTFVADIEKQRKEAQAKGREVGKQIGKVVATQKAEYAAKMKAIDKYHSAEGYDLVAMIQDGFTDKQLTELGFTSANITSAKDRVTELAKADKYKGADGYDVVAMVNAGYTQSQLTSLFGADAAGDAITRAGIINRAAKYKTGDGYDVAQMVRDGFPSADMAKLFDTSTITQATKIVAADKYQTAEGYDLYAMFDAGYTKASTISLGFDSAIVNEAWNYHTAINAMKPYKNADGTYDLSKVITAMDNGTVSEATVELVLGSTKPATQYLTVAQMNQIRQAPPANQPKPSQQAYMMGDAWGISHEQVDQIRAAPTAVAAEVYAYLQANVPGALALTHPSQLPSFQQPPTWKELASAMKDIAPYEISAGQYDVAAAYEAMAKGKLSKQSFIIAFGNDTYKDTKAFYDANVEVKPGTWVAKAEWEGLTATQQKDFIATGQYIVPMKLEDAEGRFKELQASGQISANAKYVGYDAETGNIQYTEEPTEADIRKLFFQQPANIQQSYIFRQAPYLGKRSWTQLSDKEKSKVLADFAKEFNYMGWLLSLSPEEQKAEAKGMLKEMALGAIPVYGTIRNWGNMSNTWRGISIAMDIACVLPFVTAGARAIKGVASPLRMQASALTKAELAVAKDYATTLAKTYNNKSLGQAYTNMAKAQARFTQVLAKVAQIKAKGGTVTTKLQSAVTRAELNLRAKAVTFVDKLSVAQSSIKGTKGIPVRFDSAEVKSLIRGLPNELVQNSKAAVRALEVKPGNVKALTRAVTKAEAELKAAQAKQASATPKLQSLMNKVASLKSALVQASDPVDIKALRSQLASAEASLQAALAKEGVNPSKLVDLMYDLTKAQGKLAQAKTGSVTAIYKELLKARSKGNTKRAAQLEQDLAKALNSMDAEWGQMGRYNPSGGGGIALDTKTRPFLPTTGAAPAIAVGRGGTLLRAGVTAIVINAGLSTWTKDKGNTAPEVVEATRQIATVIPKPKGVTTPEVVAITQEALGAALDAALEGKTDTQVYTQAINATKPVIKDFVDTKAMTGTEAKTVAQTAAKVATKVATATAEMKEGTKYRRLPSSVKTETDKHGRPIYPPGTVVFKMGSTKRGGEYKAMLPPYNQSKLVSSSKPPVGMRVTQGTPEQTLTFIGGKVPFSDLSGDIGVTDVFIDTKRRKIRFKGHGLRTNVGKRIASTTRGVSLADNSMRVVREGPIFLTQLRGSKGVSMSRFNPKRRNARRRRGRIVRG